MLLNVCQVQDQMAEALTSIFLRNNKLWSVEASNVAKMYRVSVPSFSYLGAKLRIRNISMCNTPPPCFGFYITLAKFAFKKSYKLKL
jgi:hypothetical protein